MLLSFGSTLKKACDLLEKNQGIRLTFEIVSVSSEEYSAKFYSKDPPKDFLFIDSWSMDAFYTDEEYMKKAGYTGHYDYKCGAARVDDPIKKIYLRIAYSIYQNYCEECRGKICK